MGPDATNARRKPSTRRDAVLYDSRHRAALPRGHTRQPPFASMPVPVLCNIRAAGCFVMPPMLPVADSAGLYPSSEIQLCNSLTTPPDHSKFRGGCPPDSQWATG